MCILAWAKSLPVFEAYAHMLIRLSGITHGKLHLEYGDYARLVERVGAHDYDNCADWMSYRFGVTHDDIIEIETIFRDAKDIHEVI